MSRLLIMGCSQRKRPEGGLLPAIERYDGPTFRVLRRFLRTHPAEPLAVYILSAKFGLIGQQELIPEYDQQMTAVRARELAPSVLARMEQILGASCWGDALLCMGGRYLPALAGYQAHLSSTTATQRCHGGLGKRVAELHDWLHGRAPEPFLPVKAARQGTARIRGQQVTGTPEQLLAVARRGLADGALGVVRCQSWYVPVDGQRVAPKWLVGQLAGLPVSAFATDVARRVLTQLGIEVMRI